MTAPTIHGMRRNPGIAGQYGITAVVEYPGEGRTEVTFVGSIYGGPIVVVSPAGVQTFVSQAVLDRLGSDLNEAWVRDFLTGSEVTR